MSAMSELSIEIQELYESGMSPKGISELLKVPASMVLPLCEEVDNTYEEWDFDAFEE